jgi:hypothetical protein
VGGEFVFSPCIIFKPSLRQFSDFASSLNGYYRYYTFGAYYSLKSIISQLRFQSDEYALLPSYLCPTIMQPFKEAGINYDFYRLKEGLRPDINDIDRKTRPGLKAILFIDYFGFPQKEFVADTVTALRSSGAKILQDTVQSWLDNEAEIYGDYCFNSLRKYSPFEASVLLSREEFGHAADTSISVSYLWHKRWGQLLRYYHLKHGCFKPQTFLRHIDKANQLYHQSGIVKMPRHNKCALDKLDFSAMGRDRKVVYRHLTDRLGVKTILGNRQEEAVPLGMGVYLENRDLKKEKLHQLDIHCPLHWLLPEEIDRKEHEYSWDLQDHALTLPGNITLNHLDEYINKLREVLA